VSSKSQMTLHSEDHHGAGVHHHHDHDEPHNDIVYPQAIPFILVHLSVIGIFWTGFTALSVFLCISLYLVRMWALTGGFHRYFSHRSYKTSRFFQFIIAFLGQTSAQRGVLWWAAIHRHHHRYSDTPEDVHSPRHAGFFMSHVGWIFSRKKATADYSTIQDFAQYPELRFLDRHPYFPAFLLAVGCYLLDGWAGLFVGFFLSTVILYHAVFAINSLAHVIGKQRYITGDDSRNNWWLALVTLGEGWHNNHHHYQSSVRQGFFWWEVDFSYYVLKVMSWLGLVWDLRAPPEALLSGEQKVGRKVIEKVAREVAETFPAEVMARELKAAIERGSAGLDDLGQRLAKTRDEAMAAFRELHLPGIPTVEEVRRRIAERYIDSPTLDQIAERAREILFERILQHMGSDPLPSAG